MSEQFNVETLKWMQTRLAEVISRFVMFDLAKGDVPFFETKQILTMLTEAYLKIISIIINLTWREKNE